jgi:fructose-1,6-bisphosphatase/inositol monophosphatase family enzyme
MSMGSSLIERVGRLLAETGSELMLPRFRALQASEISEKSPGEIVTVVDRAVEARLGPALAALEPGSRVVGEEGVADDPSLLQGLELGSVWVVDPLDGTANFVAGRTDFGIMVALLQDGVVVQSWIHYPVTGALACAERGAGAYLDGQRLQLPPRHPERENALQGVVKTGFLPEPLRGAVEYRAQQLEHRVPGTQSAAGDYAAYATGTPDFGLYWRSLPWDHAPGSLLLTEAGGHVARYDGSPYRPADIDGRGLIVARSRAVWSQARMLLLGHDSVR